MIESQSAPHAPPMVEEDKEASEHVLRAAATAPLASSNPQSSGGVRGWFRRDVIAFFLLGHTMALPMTILSTAAHSMFGGFTGAFMVVVSLSVVATAFPTPPILRFLPHWLRVVLIFIGSCLSFYFSTLGEPKLPPGQISGTSMAATVHAFATCAFHETSAYFDPRTIPAFSVGSGSAVLIGPVLYIGLMQAYNGVWRTVLLVCLCTAPLFPLVWWVLVPKQGRRAAEEGRRAARSKQRRSTGTSTPDDVDPEKGVSALPAAPAAHSGFGPERTRTALFFKELLPKYVVSQTIAVLLGIVALFGLTPVFMYRYSFDKTPMGELQFQISYLTYGIAQFLASTLSTTFPLPKPYLWAALQACVIALSLAQIGAPFFTYYGVWILFVFIHGALVGGAVVNTSRRIDADFRARGEAEQVRAFAASFGGLGSVVGDFLGGGFAIMVQRLVFLYLRPGGPIPPAT